MTGAGLSHWGIAGSTVVCTSPTLIAAYHALHRLPVPRHPPCALSSLTENFSARNRWQINQSTFSYNSTFTFDRIHLSKNNTECISDFRIYFVFISEISNNIETKASIVFNSNLLNNTWLPVTRPTPLG